MADGASCLEGKRLLIVEDEYLIALELAAKMEKLGAEVAHLAGRLPVAMVAADDSIDGALVDVNLAGEISLPLVEKLTTAGVPLILMTGYGSEALPARLQSYPRLEKPVLPGALEALSQAVFA